MFMPNTQNLYIPSPEINIFSKSNTINTGGMKRSTDFPSGLQSDPTTHRYMSQLCNVIPLEGTTMPQADDIGRRAAGLDMDRRGEGHPTKKANQKGHQGKLTLICTCIGDTRQLPITMLIAETMFVAIRKLYLLLRSS